jgi:hypothetical protein
MLPKQHSYCLAARTLFDAVNPRAVSREQYAAAERSGWIEIR